MKRRSSKGDSVEGFVGATRMLKGNAMEKDGDDERNQERDRARGTEGKREDEGHCAKRIGVPRACMRFQKGVDRVRVARRGPRAFCQKEEGARKGEERRRGEGNSGHTRANGGGPRFCSNERKSICMIHARERACRKGVGGERAGRSCEGRERERGERKLCNGGRELEGRGGTARTSRSARWGTSEPPGATTYSSGAHTRYT